MQIDHVLIATADLDAAAARLEAELGLRAVGGGRHDGIGTHNRIVPLGNGYLELLAVCDPEEAASSALGRLLAERIAARGEGLMAWAAAVENVDAEAQRTGADISEIARDGLSARLAGVAVAMTRPCLPFFIQRDPGGRDPAAGGGEAGGIVWLEVSCEGEDLATWTGGARMPVRVTSGPPGVVAVGIGEQELRW